MRAATPGQGVAFLFVHMVNQHLSRGLTHGMMVLVRHNRTNLGAVEMSKLTARKRATIVASLRDSRVLATIKPQYEAQFTAALAKTAQLFAEMDAPLTAAELRLIGTVR